MLSRLRDNVSGNIADRLRRVGHIFAPRQRAPYVCAAIHPLCCKDRYGLFQEAAGRSVLPRGLLELRARFQLHLHLKYLH